MATQKRATVPETIRLGSRLYRVIPICKEDESQITWPEFVRRAAKHGANTGEEDVLWCLAERAALSAAFVEARCPMLVFIGSQHMEHRQILLTLSEEPEGTIDFIRHGPWRQGFLCKGETLWSFSYMVVRES